MSQNLQALPLVNLTPPPQYADHDFVQFSDIAHFACFLWRRKWLIVLGILIGVSAGVTYCLITPPVYESKTQVLVTETRPYGMREVNQGAYYYAEDNVGTHVLLVQSPWFAGDVIRKGRLRSLPSLAGSQDPVGKLIGQLSVSREKGDEEAKGSSSILTLSCRSPEPEDCQIILGAVVDRYEELLDELNRDGNEDALNLISSKAEATQEELARAEREYEQFRKEAPDTWRPDQGDSRYRSRLAEIEAKRLELRVQRAEFEARLTVLKATDQQAWDSSARAAVVPEDIRQPTGSRAEEQLLALLIKEKALSRDYGEDHPDVITLRDQIELTRNFIRPMSSLHADLGNNEANSLEPYIQSLEQELRDIEAGEQLLAEQAKEEEALAKEIADYEFRDEQFSEEIARLEAYHQSLLEQLRGVDLNKELVGFSMRVIAPAKKPVQVLTQMILALCLTTAVGILLGLGLGGLAEALDKSLRSPQDIRERLGLPVIGYIPRLATHDRALARRKTKGTPLAPILPVHFRPHSAEAEAYRALRASLYFSIHDMPQRVIQITSPSPGDGSSTLAANLAVSIAQSGKRGILIDANLRNPCLHEIFGVSDQVGLSSVVNGEVDLPDAVQKTETPGLWILPAGPPPANFRDLLASPRFKELVDQLKEVYDFVMVDSPALLATADARVVASYADGVLLTIRMGKSDLPRLERAKEILKDLRANLLGAVVHVSDLRFEFREHRDPHPHRGLLPDHRKEPCESHSGNGRPGEH